MRIFGLDTVITDNASFGVENLFSNKAGCAVLRKFLNVAGTSEIVFFGRSLVGVKPLDCGKCALSISLLTLLKKFVLQQDCRTNQRVEVQPS